MKFYLLVFFIFSQLALAAQIRIPRDYTFYRSGKEISYEKAMKFLQGGGKVADIDDENRRVNVNEVQELKRGDPFPFRDFVDVEGNKISKEYLVGKPVVINFWFVGCRPCVMEIPELNQVVKEFEDEKVVFLAIANDPVDRLVPFLEKKPFDYQIIPNQMQFAIGNGVTMFPTHVFINKDGIIEDIFRGYSEGIGEKVTRKVKSLLSSE